MGIPAGEIMFKRYKPGRTSEADIVEEVKEINPV
jgi:hypothetical protein